MVRDDFVCSCGAPLEPSEPNVEPVTTVKGDGKAYYRGVCCVPECNAGPKLVPVVYA